MIKNIFARLAFRLRNAISIRVKVQVRNSSLYMCANATNIMECEYTGAGVHWLSTSGDAKGSSYSGGTKENLESINSSKLVNPLIFLRYIS